MASSTGSSASTGSPCGACKFLRRKCASDCIFAPYFCAEQGSARFAAIHKVFGASNVSKLLSQVPVPDRCEAVVTIAYEAQARVQDPVYGCVAHVFALQQQVAYLQAQLMQLKVQMANNIVEPRVFESAWNRNTVDQGLQQIAHSSCTQQTVSPQSSIDSADEDLFQYQTCSSNKRMCQNDLGELQALALRMMRN